MSASRLNGRALKSDSPLQWQKSLAALGTKVKAKLPTDQVPIMLGEYASFFRHGCRRTGEKASVDHDDFECVQCPSPPTPPRLFSRASVVRSRCRCRHLCASSHLPHSLSACGVIDPTYRAGKVELSPGLDVDVKDAQNNWLPGKISGLQGSSVSCVMSHMTRQIAHYRVAPRVFL